MIGKSLIHIRLHVPEVFLAPTRISRKAKMFVRSFVRSVQTCLELSIFIILAQTSMLTSKVSLSSLSALSQLSLSSLSALSQLSLSSFSALSHSEVWGYFVGQSPSPKKSPRSLGVCKIFWATTLPTQPHPTLPTLPPSMKKDSNGKTQRVKVT